MSLATVEGVLVRDCTPNFEFVRIINDGDVSVKTRCKTCLLEYIRTFDTRGTDWYPLLEYHTIRTYFLCSSSSHRTRSCTVLYTR